MSENLPGGFLPDQTAPILPPGFELDAPPAQEQAVEPSAPGEEKPFVEKVGESFASRGTSVAAGAVAGAALGTAAGPLGTIAGGGLGAMAGSAVYDNVSNLVAAIRDKPEEIVGAMGVTENMLGEGATDVAFSMGGALAQPLRFGRALLGKMSGLTNDASRALQKTAERLGIGVGAVDVGGALPKGFSRAIGVFPFVGTPLRKGQKAKIGEANEAINRTLNAFGPADTMDKIGVDMIEAAKGVSKEFKTTASQLYKTFEETVEAAARQDIIPTQFVREDGTIGGIATFAREAAEEAERSAIRLADGSVMPRAGTEGVTEFVEKLKDIPPLITPAQHRQLTKDLSDLIGKNLRDGLDVRQLTQAKAAMEEGFANIRTDLLPEGQAEAVKQSLDAANGFYAKGIVKFQTRASQAFERVDKAIFGTGAERAGSLNADEVSRVAVNLRSPKQIKDLTKLVGKGTVRRAAATHFDDAVTAARSDIELMGDTFSVVDPAVLERRLGLVGVTRDKIEGLREFYKTAGVDLEDITGLIAVMKKIEGVGNAAEFVRRRAIMSGAGGLAGALGGVGVGVVAGGVPGGAVTALSMTLLARHMSKIFASPAKLKLMTSALDEAADATLRRAALGKLVNAIIAEDEDEPPTSSQGISE